MDTKYRPPWLYPMVCQVCGGEKVTARGLTKKAQYARMTKKVAKAQAQAKAKG